MVPNHICSLIASMQIDQPWARASLYLQHSINSRGELLMARIHPVWKIHGKREYFFPIKWLSTEIEQQFGDDATASMETAFILEDKSPIGTKISANRQQQPKRPATQTMVLFDPTIAEMAPIF